MHPPAAPAPAPRTVDVTADDALGRSDAVDLARRLTRREVSPAELRAAAVERAQRADEALNAVTTWVEPDRLAATVVDPATPFAGVPSLIKDNEFLVGHPTSQGSAAVPDRAAPVNSPWVDQYLRLGFAPIAKTTLPEFGLTASTESTRFGPTRNPWDTGRSAGGSSGGSAALVAAGVVPIAHSNDGGGSTRIPASCCGLVGLKPSRGRLIDVPELRKMPIWITAQGVLTRTVRDTAHYYAQAERLYQEPGLPPIGLVAGPASRRLRVAMVLDGVRGLPVSPATSAAVAGAGRLLADLGHHVEQIDVPYPHHFGSDFLRYWALLAFSLRHGGRPLFGRAYDPDRTEDFTKGLGSLLTSQVERVPASLWRMRRLGLQHEEEVFARFDVLVSPVLGHEPPPIGHLGPDVDFRTHLVRLLRYSSFTPVDNVTGCPAISLPLGRSPEGLPIGVHVSAPFGQERRLLELAYEVEAANPWPQTAGS